MRNALALAALLLFAAQAAAEPPAWTVDARNSRITFGARQMGVAIPGRFERFTATIRFDAGDLPQSKAVIDIDMSSASTPNRDVETEIKREPWFDVGRHPKARFETTAFTHKGGERYEATGQLTLRGVTRPIVLPLAIRIADDPEQSGALRAQASGDVTVSRTAFGIGQGQWRDIGVVADEVVIHIEIAARRPKTGG